MLADVHLSEGLLMSTQSNTTDVAAQIGEAWSQHYHAENGAALTRFQQIVDSAPDNIDANYGLALCLKTAGQSADASRIFEKTKQLVQAEIAKQDDEDKTRFEMLSRIIDQHLSRLK